MVEGNLINPSIAKGTSTGYFMHYKTKEECKSYFSDDPLCDEFHENIEELSKNGWSSAF